MLLVISSIFLYNAPPLAGTAARIIGPQAEAADADAGGDGESDADADGDGDAE